MEPPGVGDGLGAPEVVVEVGAVDVVPVPEDVMDWVVDESVVVSPDISV